MHRTNTALILATSALTIAISGCGGSSETPESPPPAAIGDLKRVASAQELEDSIKEGFSTLVPAVTDVASVTTSTAEFSGTYAQEASVDEADSARYDGDFLYVAPARFYRCCFLAAVGTTTDTPSPDPIRSIRILETDADTADATLAGSIALEDDVSVQGMFVDGDQLFALTGTAYFGQFGGFFSDISIWAPERIGYRVYDVSDKAAPTQQVDVQMDGVLVDSRRIGDTVYIVSRHSPSVAGLNYAATTSAELAQNEALLAALTLDDLLPKVSIDGVESVLVDPANCFVATNDDGGFPVITSVTQVPMDNPSALVTTCYNEPVHGAYLTRNSLYLTALEYSSETDQPMTSVHKFGLDSATPDYRGSIDVPGHVWRGGQADFRLSEHNGDLRMLTETFTSDADDRVDQNLYVLRESANAPALTVVGELPNAERPQEIGKPNEALYGVRFLGDRAYAVTFERIDPLYALDLSDPTDPQIAGELTVTGFSDFLHPVSDELLLGLGTGDDGGVKVELFDVSVITQPLSRGAISFGAGSWSEATFNRHAFTYLAGAMDRLTIPVTRYEDADPYGFYVTGLQMLQVRDKDMPNMATLESVGEMSPEQTPNVSYVDRNRSYLNGDALFYIRDNEVFGALWQTPDAVNGPF
ncbi:MAG: beta-propeller domain-containing protein [Gammaproteobacteria bacterium]